MKQNTLGRWLIMILPLLAAAYLFYPTFRYYQLDSERSALLSDSAALDAWDTANEKDFDNAKAGRLKLGLDLRGGMYVTLEVDVLRLIEQSVPLEARDDEFMKVIEETRKQTANSDLDVLDTFLKNFRRTNRSLLQYFTVTDTRDVTEAAVERKLRSDVDDAVDQAIQVIGKRINKYAVSESNIEKSGSRRIQLELPDVKDESEIRKLLETVARLEFKRVMNGPRFVEIAMQIDNVLKGLPLEQEPAATDSTADSTMKTSTATVAKADSTSVDSTKADSAAVDSAAATDSTDPYAGLSDDEKLRRMRIDFPFSSYLAGSYAATEKSRPENFGLSNVKVSALPKDGIYSFLFVAKDLPKVAALLERPEVQRAIPGDVQIAISATGNGTKETPESEKVYSIFLLASEPELTGEVITDARATFDPTNNAPEVSMQMDATGAERWAQITGANVGKRIAIVLDGAVYSAPNVINKIPNGSSSITGSRDIEEAQLLAVVLKAGALKAPVRIIEERVVGPSLGEDSIRRGVTSSLISFAIVVLFMLAYYAMGGGFANVALLMNVLLVVAALIGFNGTLTLPGIAGIILSTAMAVDANILIFERIREEMAAGRALKSAVELGYDKAWSAIFDSNITHLLSASVLLFLGTGPVKGFALTLIIGVFMTVFTAVMVTRAMFELAIASGATTFNLGQKKTA